MPGVPAWNAIDESTAPTLHALVALVAAWFSVKREPAPAG
jgi:hypothetical protein